MGLKNYPRTAGCPARPASANLAWAPCAASYGVSEVHSDLVDTPQESKQTGHPAWGRRRLCRNFSSDLEAPGGAVPGGTTWTIFPTPRGVRRRLTVGKSGVSGRSLSRLSHWFSWVVTGDRAPKDPPDHPLAGRLRCRCPLGLSCRGRQSLNTTPKTAAGADTEAPEPCSHWWQRRALYRDPRPGVQGPLRPEDGSTGTDHPISVLDDEPSGSGASLQPVL